MHLCLGFNRYPKDTVKKLVVTDRGNRQTMAVVGTTNVTKDKEKNVAVIGSSGGGTATLGHTDATNLLLVVGDQLSFIGATIGALCYVSLDGGKGMDAVNDMADTATLYSMNSFDDSKKEDSLLECIAKRTGILRDVNDIVKIHDTAIAHCILKGQIDALICISCHTQLFAQTLAAAAERNIPVTGSGGTSLAQAVSCYGIALTGNAGGSVASTTYSRAVSYTSALASYWKCSYQPWINKKMGTDVKWTSILDACLPAFWGVCLLKSMVQSVGDSQPTFATDIIHFLENWALPTSCAVIMATSGQQNEEEIPLSSLVMGSVLASSACAQSVLAGLLAGWLIRQSIHRVMFQCIAANVPATMTNLVATGVTGGIVAVLLLPVSPVLRQCTSLFRRLIVWTVVDGPALLGDAKTVLVFRCGPGIVWGCLCCYGSKVGWYHSYFLPAILIEMELGNASFLGAVDELTLVLVCAGICAGNLVAMNLCQLWHWHCVHVSNHEAILCRRGLCINLLCGDFVEVCYPFMERNVLVNLSGYVSSGLSVAWLVHSAPSVEEVPRSLAYFPLPVSIALAKHQWYEMAAGSLIAFSVPFIASLVTAIYSAKRKKAS